MPTPTKGPRLGGSPAHERLLLSNLAKALFEHGRITTTEAKAKRLRPYAERLITKAKRGDLHARRQVASVIRSKTKPDPDAPGDAKTIVHRLFTEIAPRYENRNGGYTRITKIGPRKGDNAPMAVIELVEALTGSQQAVGEAEGATRRSAADRAAATDTTATAGVAGAAPAGVAGAATADGAVAEDGADASDAADDDGGSGDAGTGDTFTSDAGTSDAGTGDGAGTGGDGGGEGGDQQVPAEDPAEGSTSPQTESAGDTSQAEGDDDAGVDDKA